MSTTRYHPQHPLPAPVVHQAFSVPQSKSHVLAGVQDAYWSDDENEDAECPLCLEEMDISDLNFKPCVCGYQICRFCWHHIKENLNKRCPACRRVYSDDAVEFKPIATQDHKRLTQQKKQRERERKDLEALGRRHLANVRVVQRNVVYIVGIGPRFAKEELIPTLRSNEYFGQYGKITKILLVKRNQPGGSAPIVGLYITYQRREDAARAIAAVDGTPSPGGSRDVMRASYGTTKYCMSFLRGVPCNDHSCMNLHEWGDEKDCFTKEDLTTLKHTMKATESRARTTTTTTKKGDDDAALPRAASWAQKVPSGPSINGLSSPSSSIIVPMSSLPSGRQHRRGAASTRQIRPVNGSNTSQPADTRPSQPKSSSERKGTPVSRPETPAATESGREGQAEPKAKPKEPPSIPSSSPAPSVTTSSEIGSTLTDSVPPPMEQQEASAPSPVPPAPSAVPQVPPGLSAPPGIPTPSRPPRAETASPQTPLLASQSSYQMSTAARALLDDVKARRESILSSSTSLSSPFPDFDRTLQTLSADDGGGFSFNFDPKLVDESNADESLPAFDMEAMAPFKGSYVEAFPALRPPYVSGNGSTTPGSSIYDPSLAQQAGKPSSYMGSFNPFGPSADDRMSSANSSLKGKYPTLDEERKVSRFGFARHRPNMGGSPSPHPMSSLHSADSHHHTPLDEQHLHTWNSNLSGHPESRILPNALNQTQVHPLSLLSQHQALSAELSEVQLRNFIQSSQGDVNLRGFSNAAHTVFSSQHFEDPAIMSASFIPSNNEQQYFPPVAYGPPPGLPVPQSLASGHQSPLPQQQQQHGVGDDNHQSVPSRPISSTPHLPTLSSPEEFPALVFNEPSPVNTSSDQQSVPLPAISEVQSKAGRKAAKKAAAADKALERQKVAQEKAEAKARQKEKEKEEKDREKAKISEAAKKSVTASVTISIPAATVPTPSSSSASAKRAQDPAGAPITTTNEPKSVARKAGASKTKAPEENKAQSQPTAKPTKKQAASVSTPSNVVPTAPSVQVPLLSKKPKKVKPITKATKNMKDEETPDDVVPSSVADGGLTADSSSVNSRAQSVDRQEAPRSVIELLQHINRVRPGIDLASNPFFDLQKLGSPAKMPLEYGPLVHALSALSVGGGSFTNSMPSGSIDNAVSSFQQLLETLTQTISDLLRLLPRTTWDDSSSFDGVLRDMLKGDDFLDDGGEDGPSKEDEVAALTLALERRARWMEVQLSKLEELHRDINTAAVRAVLSFNDNGWDRHQFLPVVGNTLSRFDAIGIVEENGVVRHVTADELEKKLAVAKEAAVFAETEIREMMERFQGAQFLGDDI